MDVVSACRGGGSACRAPLWRCCSARELLAVGEYRDNEYDGTVHATQPPHLGKMLRAMAVRPAASADPPPRITPHSDKNAALAIGGVDTAPGARGRLVALVRACAKRATSRRARPTPRRWRAPAMPALRPLQRHGRVRQSFAGSPARLARERIPRAKMQKPGNGTAEQGEKARERARSASAWRLRADATCAARRASSTRTPNKESNNRWQRRTARRCRRNANTSPRRIWPADVGD